MPGLKTLSIIQGRKDLPWAVFVHGLGIGKEIWENPQGARVLGGLYPMRSIIKSGMEMKSIYQDMASSGYNTITWDQEHPVGELEYSLRELKKVLAIVRAKNPSGIILIGHSRGGLVARKYLEQDNNSDILAYVSIASPHQGSSMAKWQKYIKPMAAFIKPFIKEGGSSKVLTATRRVLAFMESPAIKELLPDSPVLNMSKRPAGNFRSISLGGTTPLSFRLFGMEFPNALQRIAGAAILPPEMREGLGDGLVSARSAVYPFSDRHRDFSLNHVEILFDKGARDFVLEGLTSIN